MAPAGTMQVKDKEFQEYQLHRDIIIPYNPKNNRCGGQYEQLYRIELQALQAIGGHLRPAYDQIYLRLPSKHPAMILVLRY
jgi:hypothetical protein